MAISIEEIRHLAKLSKIALTPEQEEKYCKDMDSILSFLDTLKGSEEKLNPEEKPSIKLFKNAEKYEDTRTLLVNSKHAGQHNMIEIKTSLNH